MVQGVLNQTDGKLGRFQLGKQHTPASREKEEERGGTERRMPPEADSGPLHPSKGRRSLCDSVRLIGLLNEREREREEQLTEGRMGWQRGCWRFSSDRRGQQMTKIVQLESQPRNRGDSLY